MAASEPIQIPDVTDPQMVFGTNPPLPPREAIPEEFESWTHPFNEIASNLFFKGGALPDFGLTPKPGLDVAKAMRALRCCLSSFEPKHEHKMAGVAFLLSQWFDRSSPSA